MARIGIVLSGGIAKGAYQVGVLKAISEHFAQDEIVCISAASIGVFNAYAFASGKLDKLEETWLSINDNSKQNRYVTSVLKHSYVDNIINQICTPEDKLNSKLFMSLFNFSKLRMEYVDLTQHPYDKIPHYLRAGVALPPFCMPYTIDKTMYFDGALCDNIPIFPLVDCDLDYIFCIHFDSYNYVFESTKFDNKTVKINFPDKSLIRHSVVFNNELIRKMIDDGYEKGSIILEHLLKHGSDDIEYIYKRIGKMQAAFGDDYSLRITVDVVMNNLNKVMKKLIARYKQ